VRGVYDLRKSGSLSYRVAVQDKNKAERRKMRYESSPYEFDEELDLELNPVWFVDGVHIPEFADYHAGTIEGHLSTHGFCWAAEYWSVPHCRGMLFRNYKGVRTLLTPKVVESEVEATEREAKFRENLLLLIDDFGPKWEEYKKELVELYRPFQEPDLKKVNNAELARKLAELTVAGLRMSEIHFWGMYPAYGLFIMFRDFCEELGIDTSSQEYTAILRGFDNESFQRERELWRLSRRALELGLGSIFELPAEEVAPRLQKEKKGQEWLGELSAFLDKAGWLCQMCWYPSSPSWKDDPKYAIKKVQDYLKLTEGPPSMEKIAREREAAVEKLSSKVPPDKVNIFNRLLKGAQYADAFSEEHNLYCEYLNDSTRRYLLLEAGRRFVEAGTIDEVNDIFLLGPEEVRKTLYWPERWRLQSIIKGRKEKAKADLEEGIPPIFSKKWGLDEAFGYMMGSRDPIVIQVVTGTMPKPRPELKADFVGVPGAPGVAEGPARVIFSDTQLGEVRPGEILVCPTTSVSWTTSFSLIKGVVCDRGGILSHPAVVSRQYGLPCVLNTFTATSKIKTGQRIRVDGTQGAVYILG
jgi:pyruvate,water dikinase